MDGCEIIPNIFIYHGDVEDGVNLETWWKLQFVSNVADTFFHFVWAITSASQFLKSTMEDRLLTIGVKYDEHSLINLELYARR